MSLGSVQTASFVPDLQGREHRRSPRWIAALILFVGQLPTCAAATPATGCGNSGGMIEFEDLGQPAPDESSLPRPAHMEDGGTAFRPASTFADRRQPQMAISSPAFELTGQGEPVPPLMSSTVPVIKPRSFAPYAKLYAYDWQEHVQSVRMVEECGTLYAVGYCAESLRTDDLLFGNTHPRFMAEIFGGGVMYDGQTMGGQPVSATTTYFGVRLDLAILKPLDDANQNNLYLALGCQAWRRGLSSAPGYSGYSEDWLTIYPRIGYRARRSAGNDLEGFLDISLGATAFTWESAELLGATFDVYPKVGPVFGLEAGLRWKRLFISTELTLMIWQQSNTAAYGELGVNQPDSQMFKVGLSAGLAF
jgi:hypothetical protein